MLSPAAQTAATAINSFHITELDTCEGPNRVVDLLTAASLSEATF
jgi:hypothetical protein